MATIGNLTKNQDGTFRGSLRSALRSVSLLLEPIAEADRQGAQSPHFRALGITPDGETYELGAAWLKTHQEDNGVKRNYLSMALDDPDWKSPLSCAAFPNKASGYDVIWNRN